MSMETMFQLVAVTFGLVAFGGGAFLLNIGTPFLFLLGVVIMMGGAIVLALALARVMV